MILAGLSPLANHLWQSTLFAGAAWLLTLALKRNSAAVRYWIWFAASVKFLVPFSLLVSVGSQLGTRTTRPTAVPIFASAVVEITRPFGLTARTPPQLSAPPAFVSISTILLALWLCGFLVAIAIWLRWWLQIRSVTRQAKPLNLNAPIRVMVAPVLLEPGIFGIRNPVLLLPEGITTELSPAQLDLVVAHELCHARRRDNLTAAIHMLVEAVFWFYPLVWWIRARLVDEREQACDQEVLRGGGDPQVYAEGILNVCRFYLAAPLECVSGVTGANLQKRIAGIVANRAARTLGYGTRALLTAVAAAAVAVPVIVGLAGVSSGRAAPQETARPAAFEVASIKRAVIPVGREGGNRSHIEYSPTSLTMRNVALGECVQWAYGVDSFQVAGPQLNSDSYDILAKSGARATVAQLRIMLQDLLAKRFQLALHRESRMLPVYELVVARGGPKLPTPKESDSRPALHTAESLPRVQGDSFVFENASMPEFAAMVSKLRGIELPVVDHTGIKGIFDITLKSAAAATLEADTARLFGILQEQIGLKLAAAKAPFDILVIDRAGKPTEN